MVLGKLPVPGRPTIWMIVGQGPIALTVGAGGGYLDIFTLIYSFSSLSPSLWETARYRLKYCLKGPLNPKTTNQPSLEPSCRDGISEGSQHMFSFKKISKIIFELCAIPLLVWSSGGQLYSCLYF